MYLLLALPSDTAAPVHVILYRETQQSFPFDVGVVQQYLLPRCHEDATAEARAICEAILDVEESAPLGMPDLEVWEKEPDYQVGEMLARVSPGGAASILVVCRCWQQEEENCESLARSGLGLMGAFADFSDDESEEEYVKIQIWYLLVRPFPLSSSLNAEFALRRSLTPLERRLKLRRGLWERSPCARRSRYARSSWASRRASTFARGQVRGWCCRRGWRRRTRLSGNNDCVAQRV